MTTYDNFTAFPTTRSNLVDEVVEDPQEAVREPSLADVLRRIEADPELPAAKRRAWRSALKRGGCYLGKPLEHLPARLSALRQAVERLQQTQLGISRKSLQNWRSELRAILRYAQGEGLTASRVPVLTPEWKELFDSLEDTRQRWGLSRFLRFCSLHAIRPCNVDDAVIRDCVIWVMEQSFTKNPRDEERRISRLWNQICKSVPGWPGRPVTVPDFRPVSMSVPWEAFEASFRRDVEDYSCWLSGDDLLDPNAPARPCAKSTIRQRRRYIHLLASAAVQGGVAIESLTLLADFVQPAVIKAGLEYYLRRNDRPGFGYMRDLAYHAELIAKTWVTMPQEDLVELRRFVSRLEEQVPRGMTEKNLTLVRAAMDPANKAALLRLPADLMAQAEGMPDSSVRAAIKAQLAAAIELLTVAPMRVSNLAALSLESNLLRPSGRDGPLHVFIPRSSVKNDVDLEYPIPERSHLLIDRYIDFYRPRLRNSESEHLIPGPKGDHKLPRTLSTQIINVIFKSIGLRVTPHQFRHICAVWILQAQPGNYELVRRVLGHRNLATTTNCYIGLESVDAMKIYARLIDESRDDV